MRILAIVILASCQAFGFDAAALRPGLTRIDNNRGAVRTVVIIPGVNENGGTWGRVLARLHHERVLYCAWTSGRRDVVEDAIIAALSTVPAGSVVLAHSAGGVYLYGALARHPEVASRLQCHVIAAPLGGYGFYPAPLISGLFPMIGYFGSVITFPATPANTAIYVTSRSVDPTMNSFPGMSCRFPRSNSRPPRTVYLHESTHCGAVDAAAEKIFSKT